MNKQACSLSRKLSKKTLAKLEAKCGGKIKILYTPMWHIFLGGENLFSYLQNVCRMTFS